MSVTPDEVRHVAALARLELPEERIASMASELNGILEHMSVLQRVALSADAVDQPEPMQLRMDVPGSVPLSSPVATFAPHARDGFFLVPRLATHE